MRDPGLGQSNDPARLSARAGRNYRRKSGAVAFDDRIKFLYRRHIGDVDHPNVRGSETVDPGALGGLNGELQRVTVCLETVRISKPDVINDADVVASRCGNELDGIIAFDQC